MPLPGLVVPGRGPGLRFGLAYNSLDADTVGALGNGWSSALDMRLVESAGDKVVVQEGGSIVRFGPDGSGGWVAPERFTATLVDQGSTLAFTRNHFDAFVFEETTGRLTSVRDQFGNETTVSYDGSGKPAFMEDDAGRRLTFGWSGDRLVTVIDQLDSPLGPRTIHLGYDSAGDLTSYTDAGGGEWVFTYDTAHRLVTMRKPRHTDPAKVIENSYDHLGRVAWQEDELDRRTSFDYFTPVAGSTTVTFPSGLQRVDEYVDGRCESVTWAPGTAEESKTTYVRDPDTLALISITDPAGQTTFTVDGRGNRLSATDETGRISRWSYNGFDQVTSVAVGETTSSTGAVVTSTVTYNGLGQPTSAVEAVGTGAESTVTFEYDPGRPEDLVAMVDGRAKRWGYVYDPSTGDLVEVADPLGNKTRLTYNNVGWIVASIAPKGNQAGATAADWQTSFVHDAGGRVVETTNPEGDRIRTEYDGNGNVLEVESGLSATVTAGDVTSYSYDDADQLVAVDRPGPGVNSYSYNPDGRRTSFTNENNATWTYGFDALGRMSSVTDPVHETTSYGYDSASRLATVTQPGAGSTCTGVKVNCITYSYDDAGRFAGVDYSDPATPDITGVVYDALGRRVEATVGTTTEEWTWDAASRLTSHSDVNQRITTYGWDDTSNLTSIGYPGQATPLARGFDAAGRLSSVTDWGGRTTTFGYDGNSNWTTTIFPASSQNVDVRAYDAADRLVGVTWNRGATTLGSLTYGPRDDKGMVTSVTGTGTGIESNTWTYDSRDRLTDTANESFGFDPATNLIDADGVLQVFDPAQRLCWTSPTATGGDCTTPTADATTYGYDARGNRTSITFPSGTTATYGFDAENRMVEAKVPSGNDAGVKQLETLPAARIADTVAGTGTCNSGTCVRLAAGVPVTVQVAGAGGVPGSGAVAVIGTVTVTGPVGDGWLSVNPSGDAAAGVVAVQDGLVASSGFTAQLDSNGRITLESSVPTDVSVDVAGFYRSPNVFVPADSYWSTTPTVVADSSGAGSCDGAPCGVVSGATDIDVTAVPGMPGDVSAVTVSVVAQGAGAGSLRVAPNGAASAGELIWDATFAVGAGQFTVPVNPDGTITVETTVATSVTASVTGWWRTSTSGSDVGTGLALLEGGPQRLVDTRDGTGTCDGTPCGRLVALAPAVQVAVAGQVGLNADVAAVALSVTLHGPDGAGLASLGATGAPASVPMAFDSDTHVSVIVPVDPATGSISILSWTGVDVTIDVIGGFYQPADTYTYEYDTTGLRSAKQLEGGWRAEFTWTAHGGLPLLLAEHRDGQASYVIYGPGGTPIYQINKDASVMYLHQDHQGSTRLVTQPNGTVRGALSYDTYGKITANTTPWYLERPLLTYTGEYTDTETGYIYLRARHYDPTTGQFTTLDPLVALTEEPYGYVYGNPGNRADPWGLGEVPCPPPSVEYGGGCYTLHGPRPAGHTPTPAPAPAGRPGPGLEADGFLPSREDRPTSGSVPMTPSSWMSIGEALGGGATPAYGVCALGAWPLCGVAFVMETAGNLAGVGRMFETCSRNGVLDSECAKSFFFAGFGFVPVVPDHKTIDGIIKDFTRWCFG